jgi:hypothetical protein
VCVCVCVRADDVLVMFGVIAVSARV